MFKRISGFVFFCILLAAVYGFASETPQSNEANPAVGPGKMVSSRHTVRIGGAAVPYTATVGELIILKADEKPGAGISFTAYLRDDVKDKSSRPITFCYNGGPGSSSVWLHMGGLGPRRIKMNVDGSSVPPPFGLEDNEYSLLDVTDLVFIDPVATGWSRPLPGEKKSDFTGMTQDIASVGEFIRNFISRHDRWTSPKFLLGESYGTFRSAGLSGFLQGRQHGMYLNGIVLVSSVLDFQTIRSASHHNLPYVLFLPHFTATAWYHKQLSDQLQNRALKDVLDEVRSFAMDEYLPALFKGHRLTEGEKDEVAQKLAAYTGLSENYIRSANLRVEHARFVKELLRKDRHTVGRLDSRFKGTDADSAGERYEYDPSSAVIQGAFSTMLNQYLRTELNYNKPEPYNIYGNVYPWSYNSPSNDPRARALGSSMMPSTAETLRRALTENPFLHVFCANGYYDGATPFFGTEFTFSQMGLNGELKGRVEMGYYEAGHMMYINLPSLKKFKADVASFIQRAAGLK